MEKWTRLQYYLAGDDRLYGGRAGGDIPRKPVAQPRSISSTQIRYYKNAYGNMLVWRSTKYFTKADTMLASHFWELNIKLYISGSPPDRIF